MKGERLFIFFSIIFLVILGFQQYLNDSKADVVNIYGTGAGNFLPDEDSPLIMTNASVVFDIEALPKRFNVNFTGNYTIFNPVESLNVTLVAPFSSLFKNLESSCMVGINNTPLSYGFLEYNFTDSPWDEYLDWQYMGNRKFIIINVTCPENDSLTIEFSFDAYIEVFGHYDVVSIFYDVGTSRAWNGTITERVEFKVYGKYPTYYSENCVVADIEDGKNYTWEWENEIINVNSVYISYSYTNPWNRILPFIIVPSVIAGFVILIFLLIRSTRRKDFNPV